MKLTGLNNHRNRDGTINGVTFFAEMTGLSPEEIRCTFDRGKELALKHDRADVKRIIKEEAKGKPWLAK